MDFTDQNDQVESSPYGLQDSPGRSDAGDANADIPTVRDRLSADELRHAVEILTRKAIETDEERLTLIRAIGLNTPINVPAIEMLCGVLDVKLRTADHRRLASALYPYGNALSPESAAAFLKRSTPTMKTWTAQDVVERLKVHRRKIWLVNVTELCRLMNTETKCADNQVLDAARNSGLRANPSLMKALAEQMGIKLPFLAQIDTAVELLRSRRVDNGLSPQRLAQIKLELAGAVPLKASIRKAANRLGIHLTHSDLALAAKTLRDELPSRPYSMNEETWRNLDLISRRMPGMDKHLIVDRAIMYIMRAMVQQGHVGLDEALAAGYTRVFIKEQFALLQKLSQPADLLGEKMRQRTRKRATRKVASAADSPEERNSGTTKEP